MATLRWSRDIIYTELWLVLSLSIWRFPAMYISMWASMGIPLNGWFIVDNPIQLDDDWGWLPQYLSIPNPLLPSAVRVEEPRKCWQSAVPLWWRKWTKWGKSNHKVDTGDVSHTLLIRIRITHDIFMASMQRSSTVRNHRLWSCLVPQKEQIITCNNFTSCTESYTMFPHCCWSNQKTLKWVVFGQQHHK